MGWQEELEDYISRIKEKAHDRIVEEWTSRAGEMMDESGREQARSELASVEGVRAPFIRFADGHPASCEHMTEKIGSVRGSLMTNIVSDIGLVLDAIVGWYDPVANAFREYLAGSETAVAWRLAYVDAMGGIAELQREILARTRRDVRSIAEALLSALDQPVDDGADFSLGDAFALAGAVAAIGLAVATPIPGDEVAATVVALTLIDRVNTVFTEAETAAEALRVPEFTGRRTVEILESAYGALDRIVEAVEQQESVVSRALTKVYQSWNENEDQFRPQLPAVDINSVERAELRSVDPEGLLMAARDKLPAMASNNRAAALHTASIEENEPYAFEGELHDGPFVAWRARRETLQDMCDETAVALEDVAAKLEAIAATYSDNEDTQAQGFTGISSTLEGA